MLCLPATFGLAPLLQTVSQYRTRRASWLCRASENSFPQNLPSYSRLQLVFEFLPRMWCRLAATRDAVRLREPTAKSQSPGECKVCPPPPPGGSRAPTFPSTRCTLPPTRGVPVPPSPREYKL